MTVNPNELICGNCKGIFEGTPAQVKNVKYGQVQAACCSAICRQAYMRAKFSTPVPNRGPCKGCGEDFFTRREAQFCGMKCYTGSKQFSEMLADSRAKSMTPWSIARRAEQARRGEMKPCLECGTDVYVKKAEKSKKFCTRVCYRSYMAKRFDRQIANPEALSLPQGYDGFLDREELPCLIEGCGWSGKHLSIHVNQMHGIVADELKRAAGFNLSTGLVSKPLAERLQSRALVGVAVCVEMAALGDLTRSGKGGVRGYQSLEGAEHRAKARSLAGPGPMRACRGCGVLFQQSTPTGRAIYCTPDCRNRIYAAEAKARKSQFKRKRLAQGCASDAN